MNECPGEDGLPDDALSPHVRAFLARAQRSHDVPGPEVKQRVRAAVGVALVAAPLGAAPVALKELGAATKLAARWSLGAKLGTSAVLAVLVGTGGVLLPQLGSHPVRTARGVVSAPAESAAAPVAGLARPASLDQPLPSSAIAAPAEPATSAAPAEPATSAAPVEPATSVAATTAAVPALVAAAAGPSPLAAQGEPGPAPTAAVVDRSELSLLMAASEALDAGDAERGLVLLTQHRTRFPDSALDQERRGLSLVARCLRDGAGGGVHDARLSREASAFLRRFPGAVLTARIRRTCGP
jgi:hypothetical protein